MTSKQLPPLHPLLPDIDYLRYGARLSMTAHQNLTLTGGWEIDALACHCTAKTLPHLMPWVLTAARYLRKPMIVYGDLAVQIYCRTLASKSLYGGVQLHFEPEREDWQMHVLELNPRHGILFTDVRCAWTGDCYPSFDEETPVVMALDCPHRYVAIRGPEVGLEYFAGSLPAHLIGRFDESHGYNSTRHSLPPRPLISVMPAAGGPEHLEESIAAIAGHHLAQAVETARKMASAGDFLPSIVA